MNEYDVRKDLEACLNNNCKGCSRYEDSPSNCREKLQREAISVIKMQTETLNGYKDRIVSQGKEITKLLEQKRVHIAKDEIVIGVNSIVREAFDHGYEGNWDNIIADMKRFLTKTGFNKEYCISIEADSNYPQFAKK